MNKARLLFPDLIIYAFFLLAGILMLTFNVINLSVYEPRLRKPTTTGSIVSSKVINQEIGNQTFFVPDLKFAYSVNGETYEKSAVENLSRVAFNTAEGAKVIVDEYPVGTKVPIYYPAGKPEEAIFQSGIGNDFNATKPKLTAATAGLLIVIFMVYSMIRLDSYFIDRRVNIPSTNPYQRFFVGIMTIQGTPNYDQDE